MTEYTSGPGAGTVHSQDSVVADGSEQIEVLLHGLSYLIRWQRIDESGDQTPIKVRIVTFQPRENVPQNLHQQQGVNHLNRVLDYASMVSEDGHATVYLTAEDWHVVADTLFNMGSSDDVLPDAIKSYRRPEGNQTIELTTTDTIIELEML